MAERTTSQVVGATLLGGMIGAGLAILFAPTSGKETRQQIHDKVDHLKDEAQSKLHRAKDRMHQVESRVHARRQSPVLSAWEEEV